MSFHAQKQADIAHMVSTLKASQLRLEKSEPAPCRDGCTDCEPCRKGWSDPQDCNDLKISVATANRARWKARKALALATRACEAAVREFSKTEKLRLYTETSGQVVNVLEAIFDPSPENKVKAVIGVGQYIRMLRNYNGEMAARFKGFIQRYIIKIESASDEVDYQERGFKTLVEMHKKEGCSRLFASDFNQPSDLRF